MLTKVLTGQLTFKSLRPPDLSCCTKQELREYFENSYDLNESIFTGLKDDSVIYKCPDRLRLPLVFYYAHTAVVYVNKLMLAGLLKNRINLEFETMFETGVDEMSWDDTENYRMGGSYKWPGIEEIVQYRRTVRNEIFRIIEDTPLTLPIDMESPWWGLMMGIEHERIHLETSSVLIRQLPITMVTRPNGWTYAPSNSDRSPSKNPMIQVQGSTVSYGKPKDFPSYGWDNEYGEVKTFVPAFEASKFLVTNGEFLEFVNAGGYNKKEFWTKEGWKWKTFRQAKHPTFWVCDTGCKSGCGSDLATYSHCSLLDAATNEAHNHNGVSNGVHNGVYNVVHNGVDNGTNNNGNGGKLEENMVEGCMYKYRAQYDILDMPLDWPVDVNYHEAKAYCSWKGEGYRLMAEAEYSAIKAEQAPEIDGVDTDIIYTSNKTKKTINHNLVYGSSTPVSMFPANSLGFHDVFGNVWQWMEDHFNGLCTETHWLYDDFSCPCYDGNHNVILGGSWISTGDEASRFSRFGFRRHFFQHAGFRLVRNATDQVLDLPIRIVDTDVFVLGVGIEEKHIHIDQTKIKPERVPSTNIQYGYDTRASLKGILEQEFGFRKSLPVVVVDLCRELTDHHRVKKDSAFWIGSGAGRGPFLLSEDFDKVLAVDYSGRFIDAAQQIQSGQEIDFTMTDGQQRSASLQPSSRPANVTFKQLTWLPNEIRSDNDLVVVTFLERTIQPKAWLLRLWEVTKPDGLLVIVSGNGNWGRSTLEPTLTQKYMKCIGEQGIQYTSSSGESTAAVSIWRRT